MSRPPCEDCGCDLEGRHLNVKVCDPCRDRRRKASAARWRAKRQLIRGPVTPTPEALDKLASRRCTLRPFAGVDRATIETGAAANPP